MLVFLQYKHTMFGGNNNPLYFTVASSRYEILCICTCVTHRNTIERSYIDGEFAPDNHLNDTQIYIYLHDL